MSAEGAFCEKIRNASGLPVSEEKGICHISIEREELGVTLQGVKLPKELLELELLADIAEVDGKGYLTAEFALLQKEINPVIDRVRQAGFTVSALHNHWVYEEPRIMYLHFQASGDPIQLAKGVRSAVDVIKRSAK